ncbi:MAG: hypothetical protein P4L84_01330 [Isosphaeraceae bacterium]|nr:hypothetical protein [Isosphaeraceae bacterium]
MPPILCLAMLLTTGCARVPLGNAPLTVATTWSSAERTRLERDFADWVAARLAPDDGPLRIDWVVAEPGDDLVRIAVPPSRPVDWRARPLDLMLGGPTSAYVELARMGRLAPAVVPDQPPWRIARRTAIGWAHNTKTERADATADPQDFLRSLSHPNELAFDDPRHAPLTLAWARAVLGQSTWAEGYGTLVKAAAHATRVPLQAGSACAAVERGDAAIAPALPFPGDGAVKFVPGPDAAAWVEGVAILQGGDNPTLAQLLLEFLATTGSAEAPQPADAREPAIDDLLADLLGATLVDAQNELVPAWDAWERAGRPPTVGRRLTEAPPWPPASVDKLLKTTGAGPLLDTLTDQITPDADNRAWLRRSWLAADRPVDGLLLEEIATALDGRLAREPRFRAWLRGEWTAWARQRYRRVERQLGRLAVEGTASSKSRF